MTRNKLTNASAFREMAQVVNGYVVCTLMIDFGLTIGPTLKVDGASSLVAWLE